MPIDEAGLRSTVARMEARLRGEAEHPMEAYDALVPRFQRELGSERDALLARSAALMVIQELADHQRRVESAAVDCRCDTVTELYGTEAEGYAADHLRRTETRTDRLEERYTCPHTGRDWILDYPDRTERNPGQARLRVGP
jgi:hypothetical protein